MSQLASEALGVPRESIEMVNADLARTPDSGIQGASRATYFIGSSVIRAVQNLQEQILATAAEMIDVDPSDLILEGGRVMVRSDPKRSFRLIEVAAEFDNLSKSRNMTGVFDLSPQFPQETRPEYIPLIVTGTQVAQSSGGYGDRAGGG